MHGASGASGAGLLAVPLTVLITTVCRVVYRCTLVQDYVMLACPSTPATLNMMG